MKRFLSYLKLRRICFLTVIIFAAIFAIAFALYKLPLAAVAYPAALCLLFAIGLILLDFSHVNQKHKLLRNIEKLKSSMDERLPEPDNFIEEDYQELIKTLCREAGCIQSADAAAYRDMIDYYTVWAHQIKTPIAAMKLNLQSEDSTLSRKLNSDLFRIEQYVGMVLAFLRLDSDYSDYVFRKYDIDDIIRQSVKKFASEFINRKISLEYDGIHREIVTDEKWFSFVLEQLLSNALKYSREGSIKISFRDNSTLCIADSGIGISPEDLPRIFEKGYTGSNGRSDKAASGLGLYLCKMICDRLGISLSAESKIGEGTVISMGLEQYSLKKE